MEIFHNKWLKRLGLFLAMLLVGSISGLLVTWLNEPWEMITWWNDGARLWPVSIENPPYGGMFFGSLYATSMWSTILAVRRIAYRFIPVQKWWGILVHVIANSVAAVAVFSILIKLEPLICEWLIGTHKKDIIKLSTVIPIAFGVTLVITTLLYAADFYRAMRNAERTALVSELRALRAQINPHFLFNTLNSIAALVHSRPHEAEHVIEELAELFRYTLQASKHPTVRLSDDLAATERYIAIEEARFRDRMTVTRVINEQVLDARVPSLLVQPLLENAVKHGVSKTEGPCAIHIELTLVAQQVHLKVRDTGPGFATTDPGELFVRGTGLANVRDRLRIHFGQAAQMTILPDGVALVFPYHPLGEEAPSPALVSGEARH